MKRKLITACTAFCCAMTVLTGLGVSAEDTYEFESGTITDVGDNVTEVQTYSGASNGKVVALLDGGDSVTLNVNAATAGAYTLGIRYCQPFDANGKIQNVKVNGSTAGTITCAQTNENQFKTAEMTVSLRAGSNTVTIEASWGWTYLDNLSVTAFTSGITGANATLSNPNATAETQSLYRYLCDTYGNYVLSGQQESTWMGSENYEFDIIRNASGKYPVIRGLDYMGEDFAGCNRRAKDWFARGGIVTICWHCGMDFKGSHTESLEDTPDWSKLLTPGTNEYNTLIAGMDKGAAALKELQDAGIPVIWRPFHEFDGGWFWWGKGGGENFVKLWRLMYDRYTNHWGLNNLIWNLGYSGEVRDGWYPGDEYVDIIGADTYVNHNNSLVSIYHKTAAVTDKPVCLHENGPIPDPQKMLEDGANWLWFMTWHTSFIDSNAINTQSYLNTVYNHEHLLTLDEIPDVYHYAAAEPETLRGDINTDGKTDIADVRLLQEHLVNRSLLNAAQAKAADINGDNVLNAADLTLLKRLVMHPQNNNTEQEMTPEAYMEMVKNLPVGQTPAGVLEQKSGVDYGELRACTYWSTTRERETPVNVLLPPGYNENEKYPVFYMMHGYYDDQNWMTRPVVGVQTMLGNLVASGEAQKMIIVFPYIYTSKTMPYVTGMDWQNNQNYDNFIYDLNADLMPYIEANFSVATGRENTAISGFSMGGRESLYIGMKCADKFGFVGSVCTAPGVTDLVPAAEFGFSPMPQLLMISAAVNDGVVGSNPEYYHNLYTENGVPHLWNQLPYGGHDASSVTPHLYNFMRCIFQ